MNPTKLHSSLAAAVTALPEEDQGMPVILMLRRGPIARGEMRALATMKVEHSFRLLDAEVVIATQAQIEALTDDPAVDLIWPDLPVHAWLDHAVPIIEAPRVWDSGFTGRGVKIGVIDTGLDANHPDFAGRLVAYRDFAEPDSPDAGNPRDPNGHGTHVSGIAAGSGAASDGRYRGVAPDAQLVIGRALDATGNGRTSQIMAAIEWAIEQGAQVINISLGGGPYPSDGTDALSTLCNAAVGEGVVLCVAGGNMGPAKQTIGAPAASARAITLGAAEITEPLVNTAIAEFSSRGPTADGRAKPDLLFPGVAVTAPRATGTSLGTPVNALYTKVSGTSQATPMATGTTALLLQANPRLTPDEIKARMVRGARRLPTADLNAQGSGLGDSYNTFVSAPGAPLNEVVPPPEPPPPQPPPTPQRAGCLTGMVTGFFVS
jgi:serine protease AprX